MAEPGDPPPVDGPDDAAIPRRRSIGILMLLVLLGLPFAVSMQLQGFRENVPPAFVDQPGGPLQGVLTDPAGEPVPNVDVFLFVEDASDRRNVAETQSDAEGRWSLRAPAAPEAIYFLRIGSGPWRWDGQRLTLVDADGEARDLEPIETQLEAGCTIVLSLTRKDGRPSGPGQAVVEGVYGGGGLFDPFQRRLRREERFEEASAIRIEGLPALKGELQLQLDSGVPVKVPIELKVGENALSYEL